MTQLIKLNLGCGYNLMTGFTNVDKIVMESLGPNAPIYVQHDLEVSPEFEYGNLTSWPFFDNCADEVRMIHSLEHMGQTPKAFQNIMQELYRVCAPDAKVFIAVPHPRHDDFINDPTHVRVITPQLMELFSKAKNLEWREKGYSNSQLAIDWGIDFEMVKADGILDPEVENQKLPPEQIDHIVKGLNNVVKEFHITLRCVK